MRSNLNVLPPMELKYTGRPVGPNQKPLGNPQFITALFGLFETLISICAAEVDYLCSRIGTSAVVGTSHRRGGHLMKMMMMICRYNALQCSDKSGTIGGLKFFKFHACY